MKNENENIADCVELQKQFITAIDQFEAGVFPERFGSCFKWIYKQATALLDGDFHETLQQYLSTIEASAFEQHDVISDQFIDGDTDAFKHSTMWLSIYTNRYLFPLSSSQKWSELFAAQTISMLANSVSSVGNAALKLVKDKEIGPYWQDYSFISAAQLIQLAQLARCEEDTGNSTIDIVQSKANQIQSRESRRRVKKRWEPNHSRVLKFDSVLDEDSPLSKNEQARRFLRALPDAQKPKGDNEEAHVRTLVNAHRRQLKKWAIGSD